MIKNIKCVKANIFSKNNSTSTLCKSLEKISLWIYFYYLDSIEANVELTSGHIEKGKENLVKAVESNVRFLFNLNLHYNNVTCFFLCFTMKSFYDTLAFFFLELV